MHRPDRHESNQIEEIHFSIEIGTKLHFFLLEPIIGCLAQLCKSDYNRPRGR